MSTLIVNAPPPHGRALQKLDAIKAYVADIASSIADADLTHSPDGNSVFDALALKALKSTAVATADLVAVSTPNAATQSGSYVQVDAQTIATLVNALKTEHNLVVILVNALKAKVNAMNA
jgi:hypothetical protein